MGHIDSGKTSLAKALSTNLSTASLDKSPESRMRGITLDLGFSSFQLNRELLNNAIGNDESSSWGNKIDNNQNIQITLVDCPGHASLIRTIIGGSQIIDMMFLVIDINKGIQTQTAECIVIGEITCKKGIIILNKIDQIPIENRNEKIESVSGKLRKALEKTCFKESPIVPFSANPSDNNNNNNNSDNNDDNNIAKPIGLNELYKELNKYLVVPKREEKGDLLFEFDHCFQIKGQGSVLTGTILRGTIEVNQTIQIPQLNLEKKVKSMQMFHKPIKKAIQGDRVGVCVTQLDSKLLERGLVCSNNSIPSLSSALISIEKVRFYKSEVHTKSKFHITIGHSTVIASLTYFSAIVPNSNNGSGDNNNSTFNYSNEYIYQDTLNATSPEFPVGSQFALIKFDHPILCPLNSVIIGSKLDVSTDSTGCRIAFHGTLIEGVDDKSPNSKQSLSKLKIYKTKSKQGQVERVHNQDTLIGKNLFKKDSDMTSFIGMKVVFETGETGIIESSFGKGGKTKIQLLNNVAAESIKIGSNFTLTFKRFIFDQTKSNKQ
ncbi:hypothetical protein DICPUDRAFT_56378 [Dictyostelium purpureum]|uniref:Tr-type G domain-containing protein n=1 Tax=Dictyostelium purpureum TaxID=5786 RepID=F0ZR79_DICPU|nr:uncharacterized protein DICPUDRAFT_56378 [Dictyostelium purpureum]EGC33551.1 hypothetical protein DICPUDRAFT_56378 [Dictyostelium purpureum]|eukprot:XP_003289933.1 hypothetical protein DICPUDRAFT_56378 [Dictyostelium purpureum]